VAVSSCVWPWRMADIKGARPKEAGGGLGWWAAYDDIDVADISLDLLRCLGDGVGAGGDIALIGLHLHTTN
jgi:hypothetical protein